MKVTNESSRRRLGPLVKFVVQACPFAEFAELLVTNAWKGGRSVEGVSYKIKPPKFSRRPEPHLIMLTLPQKSAYPRTSQLREDLPEVLLETFGEEFILVLAHEVTHIKSWQTKMEFPTNQDFEAYAELEGIRILGLYRDFLTAKKKCGRISYGKMEDRSPRK